VKPRAGGPFQGVFATSMLLLGWAVMAFGVVGLIHNSGRTRPDQWVKWFFGSLVAHDFVVAPVVFGIGALLAARIPARWRAPIQGGLIATGIIALMSWPLLRGYGKDPRDLSALPNNYAANLVIVLGVVWAVVGLLVYVRRRRRD
jgi:hypothetical protein